MEKQNRDIKQPEPYEKFELQPAGEILRQQGYTQRVIKNYSRLSRTDLHLAELYRLGNMPTQELELKKAKNFNPIQASVDGEGELWVHVLLELKDGISIKELRKLMEVEGYIGRFVSGRITVDNLPTVLSKTVRIESASPIAPVDYVTIPESIHANQDTLNTALHIDPGQKEIDGRNVIVGIVDTGCDFKHPNFRKADGTTRLLFLWDQNGAEYDGNAINAALQTGEPYTALHYYPERDAHGTHVMDIAAGNSTAYPGVAPAADLIFVHLGKPTNPSDELKTLGSSQNLVNAVKYIFDKAANLDKPVVINISLGANGGAHDGTSIVEAAFDQLLEEKSGRAIVIAAGNSYDDNIHISGNVPADNHIHSTQTIDWFIQQHVRPDFTWDFRQELEIWYDKHAKLTVKLFDPDNNLVGECKLGEVKSTSIPGVTPQPVIISHLPPDPAPGEDENHIDILIDNHYPKLKLGGWKIELSHISSQPENDANFHAWIERNDEYPSAFASQKSQPDYTLNTIANAKLPIVVGAYNAHEANFPVCYFSSAGPSRNKKQEFRQKPELSAPGWKIFSARATYPGGYDADGTSMAAPHVTGLIALMFQAALDLKVPSEKLKMQRIRKILIDTVDKNPPDNNTHHIRYGFGRVNGLNALKTLLGANQ